MDGQDHPAVTKPVEERKLSTQQFSTSRFRQEVMNGAVKAAHAVEDAGQAIEKGVVAAERAIEAGAKNTVAKMKRTIRSVEQTVENTLSFEADF
jgi:hypothetical protein